MHDTSTPEKRNKSDVCLADLLHRLHDRLSLLDLTFASQPAFDLGREHINGVSWALSDLVAIARQAIAAEEEERASWQAPAAAADVARNVFCNHLDGDPLPDAKLEEIAALAPENTIQAIKALRDVTKLDLRQARAAIIELRATLAEQGVRS